MINYLSLKILKFFDSYKQSRLINFLKKDKKFFNVFFDIGAHHGESIKLFLTNFKINKIYSFEPVESNFDVLKNNKNLINKKFKDTEIVIENFALGSEKKKIKIKELKETSSSTFNEININSKYFKKKKFYLDTLDNENFFLEKEVQVHTLSDYLDKMNIRKIDFIKIDTEGYEYDVLVGLKDKIANVKLIMFEHHYDDMLRKNYKFRDIHYLLLKNNFKQIFKYKMAFRKTFEYIYEKENFDNFRRNI